MLLTIIIPIRASSDRKDAIQRLSYVSLDTQLPSSIDVLVVDDGSPLSAAVDIMTECDRLGMRYLRIDSDLKIFSAGRARNVAAQHVVSKYIFFQDLDLLPYPGFYRDVLNEIEVQGVNEAAERFLMFGVIYLTKDATEEYFGAPAELRKSKYIQALLDNDKSRVEKFSTGTSVTVWNRNYYLSCGGNDPDFEGWGYEDLEFTCRAIRRGRKFPLPDEFLLDYKNFQKVSEYRGWKAVYRLYGDLTFQKGIVMFHAWHPVDETGRYIKAKEKNRKIFEKKMHAFGTRREEPNPLPQIERGRSILFKNNPWVYNRWVAPMFGELIQLNEDLFSADTLLSFMREREIDRVIFHNPYASEKMLELYRAVRASDRKFIVCERGALPGAVFFDENGFNGESRSYSREKWHRPLSDSEIEKIGEYIKIFKEEGDDLEAQPERLGASGIRRKLGLRAGAKMLFIPLQRPSDTVINHLSGPIESYENFLSLVRETVASLPPDWVVVAKRHPLEVVSPELPGVIFLDDGHINDLTDAADAVLLINSGVGVIGLVYEKPVLYAGQALYGHDGLSIGVRTADDVIDALAKFKPSRDLILQFLHYLVFEFYSFAEFKTRRVPWKDGSFMTATTEINYLAVRVPGCDELKMELRQKVQVTHDSVLFDRYRAPDGTVLGAIKLVKPKQAPATSSPKPKEKDPTARISGVSEKDLIGHMDGAQKDAPPEKSGALKKIKKLKENPIMFLRDSRFFALRKIGGLMRKGPPLDLVLKGRG